MSVLCARTYMCAVCTPDATDPLELEVESCELPCGAAVEPTSSRGAARALKESVCLQEGAQETRT